VVGAVPFTDSLDTTEATTDSDDLSTDFCGTPAPLPTDASVWYEYTAAADGDIALCNHANQPILVGNGQCACVNSRHGQRRMLNGFVRTRDVDVTRHCFAYSHLTDPSLVCGITIACRSRACPLGHLQRGTGTRKLACVAKLACDAQAEPSRRAWLALTCLE